jgi:hypothetical protein
MIQSNNAGSRIDVRPWLIKSNVSGTSYSQQLKIKPSEFFYFDFIIDTILLYFFNGYGSIRYVDVFLLCQYDQKVLMHKIIIAFVIIHPHDNIHRD